MAPYLMADDIQYCAGLTDLLEVTEIQYCVWRTCLAVTEIQYCIWRTCRLVCSLPRAHCDGRRLEQQTRSQYHFLSPLPHKIILQLEQSSPAKNGGAYFSAISGQKFGLTTRAPSRLRISEFTQNF